MKVPQEVRNLPKQGKANKRIQFLFQVHYISLAGYPGIATVRSGCLKVKYWRDDNICVDRDNRSVQQVMPGSGPLVNQSRDSCTD